jgi:tetratricopeptide (TPR) repeat protein
MLKLIGGLSALVIIILTGFTVLGIKAHPAILPPVQKGFTVTPAPTIPPTPRVKIINNDYQIFQTFNNCGPAALSMALSYYGINISQEKLGQDLRPYQNPRGDNDDKSVSLDELASKAEEYQLSAFHRPDGTVEILKQLISRDIPVITRTRLTSDDDIGHYRIIRGYNDNTGEFIQDDPMQGHNLRYKYPDFEQLWRMFGNEYLVIVPENKLATALTVLGKNADQNSAWKNAVIDYQKITESSPDDIYARFNFAVALYHTGDFERSVWEYEKIENRLPFRTLWYQIEPVQAYFQLGNYGKVFEITEKILNNQNRADSELYLIRGEIYQKQGNIAAAKTEFEKAVYYNRNLKAAREKLGSL